MAWIGDSLFSLVLTLLVGFTCNCPERPQTVQRDLRELGPTIAIAPPRIWENMLTQLRVRAADSTPLKHRLFEFFRGLAERAEQRKGEGKHASLISRLGLALGEVLVYAPVRDQLGLRRARWGYTRGAPLRPHTLRFFSSVWVNHKQGLGSTELARFPSLSPHRAAGPPPVGASLPLCEP